jgi:integrase
MARRRSLSDTGIAALKPRAARYSEPDPELRGHYVRVAPTGTKTFLAVARDPAGKQIWTTIGPADVLTVEEARATAREVLSRIRAGLPAFDAPKPKALTLQDVAELWLKRHVQANGLRSEGEVTRLLKAHVFPAWAGREFVNIRRSDVAALLDEVQDDHGARQADYVLAIVRGLCNWYAARHDDYVPPLARGMRRTDPKTRKRARILDDDELRAVWAATEQGRFAGMVRLALLTAQRREKLAGLRWADVALDGTWTVPADDRAKGTGGALVLPPAALAIIQEQPRLGPFVFGRGERPFSGFSKAKRELDAKLPPMSAWVFHDLRRTARSLLARAGVRPDVAERVMGHAIQGVEGTYDRHHYGAEKADALRRLAGLVESIVSPPTANVVPLMGARHG